MSGTTAVSNSSRVRRCAECANDMPISRTNCPHCGRPQLFPNVDLANRPIEKTKLVSRYQAALAECRRRGCEETAQQFTESCTEAVAVFACSLQRLHRQVASGTDVFETFYDLDRLRLQTSEPGEFDWGRLRPQAEIELLGSHVHLDKLHYACLSLDGLGLSSYGDCLVVLANHMVGHRTTCFEGNSAVIYAKDHDFSGYLRCDWANRHVIATAVFAHRIDHGTEVSDFPSLLVEVAGRAADDSFIEAHVFGPMTARTFQSVRIDASKHRRRRDTVLRKAIEEKMTGVHIEVINA